MKLLSGLSARVRRSVPRREHLERSRWVPNAVLESALWRFTRRSVPRAVALGIAVGVLVPVAQFVVAAILAMPTRANVPVAMAATLITNPFTLPLFWTLSYQVGAFMLRLDAASGIGPIDHLMRVTDGWALLEWLTSEGKVLALGLVAVAAIGSSVGYLATSFGWRWWVARRRRRARTRRG